MITGCVKGQYLSIASPLIVTDSINYLSARFYFSEDWDNAEKWAHFKLNGSETVYDIKLNNDEILADEGLNLTTGDWEIYLHGTLDSKRITTNSATINIKNTGTIDGEPFPKISVSVTEQLWAAIGDISGLRTEEKNSLVSAINEVFMNQNNGADVSPEKIAEAVEQYLKENPITEFDPTVPDWAKQKEKPTYTAQEVGALPSTTEIPSVEGFATEEFVKKEIAKIEMPEGDVNGIKVVDNIDSASGEVVYVTDEEADGDIAAILKNYQLKTESIKCGYLKLDDGYSDGYSWSSDCEFIITPTANILIDIGRLQDMDSAYDYEGSTAGSGSRVIEGLLNAGIDKLDYIFLSHYHHDHCGCWNRYRSDSKATDDEHPTGLHFLWDDERIDTSNCAVILPTMPSNEALSLMTSDMGAVEVNYIRGRLFGTKKCGGFFADHPEVHVYTLSVEGGYWKVEDGISLESLSDGETVWGYDSNGNAVSTTVKNWAWSTTKPRKGVIFCAHNCTESRFANYVAQGVTNYNEYGTVIEVEYGYTLATYTADTSYYSQMALCDTLRQTDILKLPHHKTDVNWHKPYYERLNPRYAVASVDVNEYEQVYEYLLAPSNSIFRPTIAWLSQEKIPIYPLGVSGTSIFESNGEAFRLISNNRNYQPKITEGELLWQNSEGVGAGSTIDMSGTGWRSYRLFQVTFITVNNGSVGTSATAMFTITDGVEYFRGIGGYAVEANHVTYALNGTVSGDIITLVAINYSQHKTTSTYHTVTGLKITGIYGLC